MSARWNALNVSRSSNSCMMRACRCAWPVHSSESRNATTLEAQQIATKAARTLLDRIPYRGSLNDSPETSARNRCLLTEEYNRLKLYKFHAENKTLQITPQHLRQMRLAAVIDHGPLSPTPLSPLQRPQPFRLDWQVMTHFPPSPEH